jgi:hypothetical protein
MIFLRILLSAGLILATPWLATADLIRVISDAAPAPQQTSKTGVSDGTDSFLLPELPPPRRLYFVIRNDGRITTQRVAAVPDSGAASMAHAPYSDFDPPAAGPRLDAAATGEIGPTGPRLASQMTAGLLMIAVGAFAVSAFVLLQYFHSDIGGGHPA